MIVTFQSIPALVSALVMICWFVFAGAFIFRKKPEAVPEQRRERVSIIGLLLRGVAYAIVWFIHRPAFSPVVSFSQTFEIIVAVGTVGVACVSVAIVRAAV